MADLDSAPDLQLAALLELAKAGVNAELEDELGGQAIVTIVGHPVAPKVLGNLAMPTLAIWRRAVQHKRVTMHRTDKVVDWVLDYIPPTPPRDDVAGRWRLLEFVWETLVDIISVGHHPALAGDANVLRAAGFTNFDWGLVRATNKFFDEATLSFPWFRGELRMSHRDAVDLSALSDLISIDASYVLPDATITPLVEEILT